MNEEDKNELTNLARELIDLRKLEIINHVASYMGVDKLMNSEHDVDIEYEKKRLFSQLNDILQNYNLRLVLNKENE